LGGRPISKALSKTEFCAGISALLSRNPGRKRVHPHLGELLILGGIITASMNSVNAGFPPLNPPSNSGSLN
jgi:hypothetical protein